MEGTWELCRENAHPKASEQLAEDFFWSVAEENSPLGNEAAGYILTYFFRWRHFHPEDSPLDFLDDMMLAWEIPEDVPSPDEAGMAKRLPKDKQIIFTYDDMVIALAFSQIMLEGELVPSLKAKAQEALEHQAGEAAITHRRWKDPEERHRRLKLMGEALDKF